MTPSPLRSEVAMAITRNVPFPPGVDIMRSFHIEKAADEALAVIRLRVEGLRKPRSEPGTIGPWSGVVEREHHETINAVLELLDG